MNEIIDASLQDIGAFVAVARTGGFTSAAERLGTSKSNVGKAVQRLERHLGTLLFQRTTRAVSLTEDGELYLAAAQAAIDSLRGAEQALASQRADIAGRVRIDIPTGFGRLLLPTLGGLRARHPRLTVEMATADRMSDPVADGWDIVVRIGQLPAEGEMTVRKICDTSLGLYAAPSYLAARGAPASLEDLQAHEALLYRSYTGQLRGWQLLDKGARRELMPAPALILGDAHALVDATLAGYGIAQMLDRFVAPELAAGRLAPVLPATVLPGPPVHALIPAGRRMNARTRAVLEHIVATLRGQVLDQK